MAAVSVFVDDAVQGRLPLVCAKTGEPTDIVIRRSQPVGGPSLGVAWLLVFLGPPGWLALLAVAAVGANSEYLTVRVPESAAAFRCEKSLERFRTAAFVAGALTIACGIVEPGHVRALWLAGGAALLVAAVALQLMVWRQAIGVRLDASRRWVTLTNVHPVFRAAAEQEASAGHLGR